MLNDDLENDSNLFIFLIIINALTYLITWYFFDNGLLKVLIILNINLILFIILNL